MSFRRDDSPQPRHIPSVTGQLEEGEGSLTFIVADCASAFRASAASAESPSARAAGASGSSIVLYAEVCKKSGKEKGETREMKGGGNAIFLGFLIIFWLCLYNFLIQSDLVRFFLQCGVRAFSAFSGRWVGRNSTFPFTTLPFVLGRAI